MKRIFYLFFSALVFLFDQSTKHLLMNNLKLGEERPLLPFFTLVHWQNRGGLWGFLGGASEKVTFAIFMILPVLGVGFLFYLFFTVSGKFDLFLLSAMLGGAFGNILDRLLNGAVTDFLYFHVPGNGPGWPAFNVADAFLSTSLTIFLLTLLFVKEKKNAPAAV